MKNNSKVLISDLCAPKCTWVAPIKTDTFIAFTVCQRLLLVVCFNLYNNIVRKQTNKNQISPLRGKKSDTESLRSFLPYLSGR